MATGFLDLGPNNRLASSRSLQHSAPPSADHIAPGRRTQRVSVRRKHTHGGVVGSLFAGGSVEPLKHLPSAREVPSICCPVAGGLAVACFEPLGRLQSKISWTSDG